MNNSISNMELKKLRMSIKLFIQEYKDYSKRNVKVLGVVDDLETKQQLSCLGFDKGTDYLAVDMFTEIPENILMTVYDILQSFVQICETHLKNKEFMSEDEEFISGAKCVDNIIKHKSKTYMITDLLMPNFTPEFGENARFLLHANGIISIPIDKLSFRMGAVWVSICDDIIKEMKKPTQEKHFPNYEKWFAGKDVIETVYEMHRIVDEYIACEEDLGV